MKGDSCIAHPVSYRLDPSRLDPSRLDPSRLEPLSPSRSRLSTVESRRPHPVSISAGTESPFPTQSDVTSRTHRSVPSVPRSGSHLSRTSARYLRYLAQVVDPSNPSPQYLRYLASTADLPPTPF